MAKKNAIKGGEENDGDDSQANLLIPFTVIAAKNNGDLSLNWPFAKPLHPLP